MKTDIQNKNNLSNKENSYEEGFGELMLYVLAIFVMVCFFIAVFLGIEEFGTLMIAWFIVGATVWTIFFIIFVPINKKQEG